MRLSSPLEKRRDREEAKSFIREKREDVQAHDRDILTSEQIQAKKMADLNAAHGMARQGLINKGSADVANIGGNFGMARQGLANEGAINSANVAGGFRVKTQEMADKSASSRLGAELTHRTDENTRAFDQANKLAHFNAAATLAPVLGGDAANRVQETENTGYSFAGIPKPSNVKFVPDKGVADIKGGVVFGGGGWADSTNKRFTPLSDSDKSLAMDEDYLRYLKTSNPERYEELRRQYEGR